MCVCKIFYLFLFSFKAYNLHVTSIHTHSSENMGATKQRHYSKIQLLIYNDSLPVFSTSPNDNSLPTRMASDRQSNSSSQLIDLFKVT